MDYRKIKNLKGKVEEVLRDVPETRNSDISLTINIWRRMFPDVIKIKEFSSMESGAVEVGQYILLSDLYWLPREDNIKRARAFIQNVKKKYPPTEWSIAKARGFNEDEWRVAMGYPTKESAGTGFPSWTPPSLSEKTFEKEVVCEPVEDNKLF
jgi:hypothetical protein